MAEVLRIKSLIESLPSTQRKLAEFIVDNQENVPFMSVHELAAGADVSVATVSRFAQFLGYESFKEFKKQVGRETQFSFEGIYEKIEPGDKDDVIVDKIFSLNMRSIEDTLKMLKVSDLVKVAKAISKSPRVLCLGIGGSGNMSLDTALRFSQIGVCSDAYVDSYQMMNQALQVKKGHVVIGVSHSGRSSITVRAMELAKTNGALTVGCTNYVGSPLAEYCDVLFCTSFTESKVEAAALSSRVAQMCIFDTLYMLTARYKRVSRGDAEALNEKIESFLRMS